MCREQCQEYACWYQDLKVLITSPMDIFLSSVSFSVIIVLLSNDLKPFDHIIFCLGEGSPEKSCCQWILSGKSHHQSQVTLTWLRCIRCITVKALASIFPQNMLNLKSSIMFSGRVSCVLDIWWVDWRLQTTFGLPETRWGWCIYCRGNKKHIVCNFRTFVCHFISLIWHEVLF